MLEVAAAAAASAHRRKETLAQGAAIAPLRVSSLPPSRTPTERAIIGPRRPWRALQLAMLVKMSRLWLGCRGLTLTLEDTLKSLRGPSPRAWAPVSFGHHAKIAQRRPWSVPCLCHWKRQQEVKPRGTCLRVHRRAFPPLLRLSPPPPPPPPQGRLRRLGLPTLVGC